MLVESRNGSGVFLLGSVSIGLPVWHYGVDGATSNVGFSFHGPYDDQLGAQLAHMENISDPIDIADFGGYYAGREIHHLGFKPSQADLSPDGVRNWEQYVSNLQQLFGGWNFGSVDAATAAGGRENPVHHPNLFGRVISGVRESSWHRPSEELEVPPYWPTPPAAPFFSLTIHGPSPVGVTGLTVSNQFDPGSWYPWCRLVDGLKVWKPLIDAGTVVSNSGYSTVNYRQLNYTARGAFVTWYGYQTIATIDNPSDPYVYLRIYAIDHRFSMNFIAEPPLETEFLARDYVAIKEEVSFELLSDNAYHRSEPGNWLRTTSIHGSYTPLKASYPVDGTNWLAAADLTESRVNELIGKTVGGVWYQSWSNKTLSDFAARSASLGVDIRSTVFFSANDAVQKIFPQFESNHVEALIELRSIAGLLNPVGLFATIAERYRKGRKVSFRSLINFLTDAQLTYALGIAPTVADAVDIARRSRWIIARMKQDLTVPVTAYGDYYLPLEDEPLMAPFVGAEVLARTKLRASLSEDSLWAALMPFRSVNLLPTLSNVWDLLPYTFIIDQFTNIGDYLEAVDSAALFLGIEVEYVVHSTTLTYNFTEEDCEEYGFSISKEGQNPGAGYKIYNRWVSGEMPVLLPTHLNVFRTPVVNNFATLGSLLYKLV